MSELVIMCVEDESEVREVLVRDIAPFANTFRIEEAESVDEAREVVQDCLRQNCMIALVLCDHLLPGTLGVDFLIELNADERTRTARKVLVTGQAGHDDTIEAVNKADLHYYIAKPWHAAELVEVTRRLLTDYVIKQMEDLLPYMNVLDAPRLLEALRTRRILD